mgnify:FL=1
MFNSKYSKTLTVILILVIITIVGLLIFFGIDVYRRYYIEQTSGEVVNEFRNQFNEITTTNEVEDNTIVNDVTPNVDLNTIYENTVDEPSGDENGVTIPGTNYNVIGVIEIPAIDIEYPIVPDYQGSINSLNVAIVMLYPSNMSLNEVGNAVLAGHNYRNGTFFSNNKRLEEGDKIYITDASGERVEYEVVRKYETSTSDSSYMKRDTNGKRGISLTTCTDDTRRRLIIWADEV